MFAIYVKVDICYLIHTGKFVLPLSDHTEKCNVSVILYFSQLTLFLSKTWI